ncbi:hypothetical protein EX30DRAFT_130587 [Ascodesmis nigricans]|uniref:Uncharacterized protein n=1 Tax=Ascodesmis nigricans TaxID=341454 RepID=A0A4S2MNT8_9PEZI|nr:hypothetical protein EX30DRAFT_130587 [Ascodesmis nigricans]
MCDYEKVIYGCGHFKLLVKGWCPQYVRSAGTKRCGVHVVGEVQKGSQPCSINGGFWTFHHHHHRLCYRISLTLGCVCEATHPTTAVAFL